LAALAGIACAPAAWAQASLIDEFRFGVLMHSIEPGNGEDGADINLELLSHRPLGRYGDPFLDFALRPRLHLGASINTVGETSQLYGGLTWDVKLTQKLTLELSFGGAVHNGPTATAWPIPTAARAASASPFRSAMRLTSAGRFTAHCRTCRTRACATATAACRAGVSDWATS
jgi:hypothetical protein